MEDPTIFFFNDTATTEIYTLSLHDALPICRRTASPTATVPVQVDPVTTVPAPATAKTRSIGNRNRSSAGRSTRSFATRRSADRSSSSPSPVSADVAIDGSHGTRLRFSRSLTSDRTRSSHSGSTKSCLVMTGMPRPTKSEEHTSELQSQSNLVCRLLLQKKHE